MPVGDDDSGLDGMQCHDHPFQNTSPGGGICAVCLKEKLGKLVSSSSSSFFVASSSSSPSFRSDLPSSTAASTTVASTSLALSLRPTTSIINPTLNNHNNNNSSNYYATRKSGKSSSSTSSAALPFLLTQKKKKKQPSLLNRSKSTATPRSATYFPDDYSPRRRGFWSFLHLSSKKPDKTTPKSTPLVPAVGSSSAVGHAVDEVPVTVTETMKKDENVVVEDSDSSPSPNNNNNSGNVTVGGNGTTSFGRKVSRSRSVGCGSRSFSGDFFERISTGFGDCTLRRVESQREGGGGASKHRHSTSRASAGDVIKERVRCGGLFGGFMMITSSSSSSASSSSYWVSSNDEQHNGGLAGPGARQGAGPLINGRNRSWGWALASPMRAFNTKPSSGKRDLGGGVGGGGDRNGKSNGATAGEEGAAKTANLDAIPSLLSVRS